MLSLLLDNQWQIAKDSTFAGVILVIHLRNIFNSVNTFLMCI